MRVFFLSALFIFIWAELAVFISVAQAVGLFTALVLIFLTSALGFALIRHKGWNTLRQIQQKMVNGDDPSADMINVAATVMAGMLLILPGFISDLAGVLLLLPWVRQRLVKRFLPYLSFWPSGHRADDDHGHVYEGEYTRKTEQGLPDKQHGDRHNAPPR